jgi:hypothetical protein
MSRELKELVIMKLVKVCRILLEEEEEEEEEEETLNLKSVQA